MLDVHQPLEFIPLCIPSCPYGAYSHSSGPALELQGLSVPGGPQHTKRAALENKYPLRAPQSPHPPELRTKHVAQVGNLSFYTTEEQIYELFSKCTTPEDGGGIKRIIMGLDRNTRCVAVCPVENYSSCAALYRTPCGFCFVEYYSHAEALACLRYISGTKLDERIIRCDLDLGYRDGRQFGRGKSGGQVCTTHHSPLWLSSSKRLRSQVRDEHRDDYDPGRGGWGAQAQRAEIERKREMEVRYHDSQDVPGAVAGGGGDWKEAEHTTENTLKRARSPEDEGDSGRGVRTFNAISRAGISSDDVQEPRPKVEEHDAGRM